MFNRKKNNNRNEQKKFNMRSFQLYNDASSEPSTIAFGFWNNYATVRINPALPEKERKDGKVYDYDTSLSALFNVANLTLLIEALDKYESALFNDGTFEATITKKKKDPADKKKKKEVVEVPLENISLQLSDSIAIKIGNGKEYKDLGPYVAIVDYSRENEAVSLFYEFKDKQSSPIMLNFNEDEGKSKKEIYMTSDYAIFKNFLIDARNGLSNAAAYGVMDSIMYYINLILDKISILDGKIDTGVFGKGSKGNSSSDDEGGSSGSSRFSSRRRNTGSSSSSNKSSKGGRKKHDDEEVDDIDDIEKEIEDDMDDEE